MALNYWHADFKFVPASSLARKPSRPQQSAIDHIRRMLKAFGSSGETFEVPSSGRRITSLISLLADLSDLATWEGVGGDSYSRTFPGANGGLKEGLEVARDLDRADELRPYRDLQPDRLKLYGHAQWDPSPYLSDQLWMAYVEPFSIRWAEDQRTGNAPNLTKEDPTGQDLGRQRPPADQAS